MLRNRRSLLGAGICSLVLSALCSPAAAGRIAIPAGFPNASTTGHSGSLTPSGAITVTAAGTVVQNLDISGGVQVKASNVTIRNCRITGGLYGVNASFGYTGTVVEDCTIYNGNSKGVYGGNMTVRRCNISMYSDCMMVQSNVLIEDSWLHDLKITAGSHNDGVQCTGGSNITIRHCSVQGQYQNQTSAFIFQTNNSPITNVLFENNFLSGGTYTVYIRDKGTGYGAPTNVRLIGNVFEYDGYQFGHLSMNGSHTFECNTFHTGEPIPQNPPCNQGPTADAGGDQTITDADGDGFEPLILNGSASTAAAGHALAWYTWTEGSTLLGWAATVPVVLDVGVHTITLTVADDQGAQATDDVVITIEAGGSPIDGDANGDGCVDISDFVILKNNFGRTDATRADGDFDGDGEVGISDFVILKNNFGAGS